MFIAENSNNHEFATNLRKYLKKRDTLAPPSPQRERGSHLSYIPSIVDKLVSVRSIWCNYNYTGVVISTRGKYASGVVITTPA